MCERNAFIYIKYYIYVKCAHCFISSYIIFYVHQINFASVPDAFLICTSFYVILYCDSFRLLNIKFAAHFHFIGRNFTGKIQYVCVCNVSNSRYFIKSPWVILIRRSVYSYHMMTLFELFKGIQRKDKEWDIFFRSSATFSFVFSKRSAHSPNRFHYV